jgi:hypothetical protein
MVGLTFGPEILGESNSLALVKQLLLSYLTGFGISTAVGLLVFPQSSRKVFLEGSQSYLSICDRLLREEKGLFELILYIGEGEDTSAAVAKKMASIKKLSLVAISTVSQLTEELSFADSEISFHSASSFDLSQLLLLLQALLIPLLGLSKMNSLGSLMVDKSADGVKLSKLTSCSFGRATGLLQQVTQDALLKSNSNRRKQTNQAVSTLSQSSTSQCGSSEDQESPPHFKKRKGEFEVYRVNTLRALWSSNKMGNRSPNEKGMLRQVANKEDCQQKGC